MRIYNSLRGWLTRLYAHPYNRERPVTALARLGRWQTLRYSGHPRDLRFWGTRMIRCYPDADGSMWLILNVVMDWNEFHFIRQYLRADDTLIDVGANLGIYTLWASQFIDTQTGQGQIVAFEPDSQNLARLQAQLALNHLHQVQVVPIALSASTGSVRFSKGKDGLNHLLTEATIEAFTEVATTTLDAYCTEHSIKHVSFAKIDVEGAEQLVLAGASRMLTERRIDVIQLEFNDQVLHRGLPGTQVENLLDTFGYARYRFDADTCELVAVPQVDLGSHENLFAIHDLTSVQQRLIGRNASGHRNSATF